MKTTTERIAGTPLHLTIHNAGFWQVSLDAPPFNLFGPELLTGLEEVVRRMQASTELRVIVFDSVVPDFFISFFFFSFFFLFSFVLLYITLFLLLETPLYQSNFFCLIVFCDYNSLFKF